jgi:hypothetical protein
MTEPLTPSSTDTPSTPPPEPSAKKDNPSLTPFERRALGVLVEKARTTATSYPMTLNSLVAGCNQSTNRFPVTDYEDDEVETALENLERIGLVERIIGGRVDKWKHKAREILGVTSAEMAVLVELLLRGPQSLGELRTHVSRLEEIADLDALKSILKPLAERGLVFWLTEENRRGATVAHGMYPPEEFAEIKSKFRTTADSDEASSSGRLSATTPTLARLEKRIEDLEATVLQLQTTVKSLSEMVENLTKKQELQMVSQPSSNSKETAVGSETPVLNSEAPE